MERAQERHTVSLVLARAVYSRSAAQWAGHGWGIGAVKNAWATSTAWLPMSKSHSPSQPQLITTLTSEGTKAWTYICFGHDLQILNTVTGKTVTKTGVVGQGQNNQLHPDFLVPPFQNKQGRTGVCALTALVHKRTVITFPIKDSWYQLNSRALWSSLGNKNWKLTNMLPIVCWPRLTKCLQKHSIWSESPASGQWHSSK